MRGWHTKAGLLLVIVQDKGDCQPEATGILQHRHPDLEVTFGDRGIWFQVSLETRLPGFCIVEEDIGT